MNRWPARIAIFSAVVAVTVVISVLSLRSKRNNDVNFVGANGLIAAGSELDLRSLDVDAPTPPNIEQPPNKPSDPYLPEIGLRLLSVPLVQKIPIYDYDPFGRRHIAICYLLRKPPQDLTKVGNAADLPQKDNGN